ncbi:hypothetical protein A3C87_03090 [Candidatus Kaiserbacteria bacterium RIFCSPHIGHO2_02_FULL_49_34]|uniref:L,D-TPase catalytic domain-containing protein n=1 Tax=Candidatus Kaiserbacteria bacterium RIFCSPHIGHO2_02_FULL_49_34 TaxID=1798491 RepID=A0A1F6DIF7_9BACT|nr:MAG: hypothetical protein A3C87_03090 [Candidatus Kaiserbacteria bacterium RIFCSPHIGHO2_02_FULL_49_34]
MKIVLLFCFLLLAGGVSAAERSIVIDLAAQTFTLYEGKQRVHSGIVSTGREGHDTPKGVFRILKKKRHHISSEYGTPMLFSLFFTSRGHALHLGRPTGNPASAGCIRLSPEDALFAFRFAELSDTVIVQ